MALVEREKLSGIGRERKAQWHWSREKSSVALVEREKLSGISLHEQEIFF